MNEKVEQIIQQIMEKTDLKKEELTEKIEDKQEELSGFITAEGAAIILAREHGIITEREEPKVRKLRIDDLSEGMSNVDIVGKVSRILEPREFERRDGSKGKVANIILMDKTGKIRVVLWDEMADLITEEEIQKGVPIRMEGAYIKKGINDSPELNVGRRGTIEIYPSGERAEDLPPVPESKIKISDLDASSDFVDVVGRVTAITAPREFERSNGSVGKVATLRIVDETGQTRVSLWGEKAEKTEEISRGDAIGLENASVREGRQNAPELHMNQRGRIILNPPREEVENLPELGKKLLKIEEIEPNMPVLDLVARVRRKFTPTEFSRSNGSTGRVMNVILADETGTIRASLWDDMVETGEKLSPGDIVSLENARSSTGLRDRPEIRIGQRTNVKINPEDIEVKELKSGRLKLSELEEGLDSLEVVGRVIDFSETREFTRSGGGEGKVASLTLGDQTGMADVTLWGPKTEILEDLEAGDIIRINDSYSVSGRYGEPEIHVGEGAELEVNPPGEDDLQTVSEIREKFTRKNRIKIKDAKEGSYIKIRGTIANVFQRKPFFNVCPNCGRSLKSDEPEPFCEKCEEKVKPDRRIVISVVVDDGTGNIRVVIFGKLGENLLGKSVDEVHEISTGDNGIIDLYKELDLLGREIIFTGTVRRDNYFDQLELRARDFEYPDSKDEARQILEKTKA